MYRTPSYFFVLMALVKAKLDNMEVLVYRIAS